MVQKMVPVVSKGYQQFSPTQVYQLLDPMGICLAETRTHNSEVRLGLAQLGGKIDSLLGYAANKQQEMVERRLQQLEEKLLQSPGSLFLRPILNTLSL